MVVVERVEKNVDGAASRDEKRPPPPVVVLQERERERERERKRERKVGGKFGLMRRKEKHSKHCTQLTHTNTHTQTLTHKYTHSPLSRVASMS